MTTTATRLTAENKKAWDDLYGATDQPVWGRLPIGFLLEFLAMAAPPLGPGLRALDAGTGEGRNVAALERSGAWVSVCDASAHGLSKIPALVRSGIPRAQCDLGWLPYRNGAFDFVLMTDVIETLPDPEPALAEVLRVLRPRGQFLCNIPGHHDPIATVDMAPIGSEAFLYRAKYFFRFMEMEEAAAMIRRHGFEIVRSQQRTWVEEAHPGFRAAAHRHTTNVFLAVKA